MGAIILISPLTKFCRSPAKRVRTSTSLALVAANFLRFFIGISPACAGYAKNTVNMSKGAPAVICRRSLYVIRPETSTIFSMSASLCASGFRDDTKIVFYNHHEAHALAPLDVDDDLDSIRVLSEPQTYRAI